MQIKGLQERILEVTKEEPYWGEKIPLRWMRFEETKETFLKNPLKTLEQVTLVGNQMPLVVSEWYTHPNVLLSSCERSFFFIQNIYDTILPEIEFRIIFPAFELLIYILEHALKIVFIFYSTMRG